ncbi:hypothetical protein NLJ89_g1956 [Agrocybe chaxingu]|uniref:Peptidase M20 dimerisation domain-containing protein n=1 Tax=Agrocybe chaxingu TaxID=84603 RepID=A0A9W8MZ26_9AGAR|nr:hypothetical protein NLJ89_g1956 [Agrocybe chaxingu]
MFFKRANGDPLLLQPVKTAKKYQFKWFHILVAALTILGLKFLVMPAHDAVSTVYYSRYRTVQRRQEGVCPQPQPPAQASNISAFVDAPGFASEASKRLAGAVQIPTVTFDDMGPAGEDERWAPFEDLHAYLRTTFPAVHSDLELTVIAGYSLVYTWRGSVEDAGPLMLTGHLDVVPVTALDRWTYPPFSGTIDEEWIHGRGSWDCKNNVIGILTAVEHLITIGWKPRRTISDSSTCSVLAFGQDEEISGPRGAANIGKHLEALYGKHGIALLVDEGGSGLDAVYGSQFALPGVAEKGYINVEIDVDMAGGHSSVPPAHTSIGILSKIVSEIEDASVFQPHIETTSPIWSYLECVARHGDASQTPSWITDAVSSSNPDLNEVANRFAETSLGNRYLVQTSKAATIFNAGLKSNALAENAHALFNTRIEIFSSPEKYSLLLNGDRVSEGATIGNITVEWNKSMNPSPIAPSTIASEGWDIFSRAVQATFGEEVITAPSAMTGNTDTRHYWNLSENIYRWSPTRVGTRLGIHTVDERISAYNILSFGSPTSDIDIPREIVTHVESIKFYTELILQSDARA